MRLLETSLSAVVFKNCEVYIIFWWKCGKSWSQTCHSGKWHLMPSLKPRTSSLSSIKVSCDMWKYRKEIDTLTIVQIQNVMIYFGKSPYQILYANGLSTISCRINFENIWNIYTEKHVLEIFVLICLSKMR